MCAKPALKIDTADNDFITLSDAVPNGVAIRINRTTLPHPVESDIFRVESTGVGGGLAPTNKGQVGHTVACVFFNNSFIVIDGAKILTCNFSDGLYTGTGEVMAVLFVTISIEDNEC